MTFLDVLGMLGGFIASFGMAFQVHKTVRDRAIKDISLSMLCANILGMLMVLVFSIGTKQPTIYIPLCFSFGCNIFLMGYKLRFIREKEGTAMLEHIENSSDIIVTVK